MMVSTADELFLADFESGRLPTEAFDHRAHVRAAYIYLAHYGVDVAMDRMRDGLRAFISHHGIPPARYHETLTRSWLLAVHHFMANSPATASADAFIDANPRLLDSRIMLTHYQAATLFSDNARAAFIEPDLEPIPRKST